MPEPLTIEPTEAAYWAGLIDGEGHLGIRHFVRKKDGGEQYSAKVALRLTDESVIRAFAKAFDLPVYAQPPQKFNHAVLPIYGTERTGKGVIVILQALLPYLRIKRAQADRLLALETSKLQPGLRTRLTATYVRHQNGKAIETKSYSYAQECLDRWAVLCAEVSRLNRPGRETEPAEATTLDED